AGPDWTDRQLMLYADFVKAYLVPVRAPPRIDYDNGGFWVFRLADRPAPRPQPLWFLPYTESLFHACYGMYSALHLEAAQVEADKVALRLPGVFEAAFIQAKLRATVHDYRPVVEILEPVNRAGFIGDANFKVLAAAAANQDRIELAVDQYARQWQLSRDNGLLPPYGWCLYKLGQVHASRGESARAARDLEQAEVCAPAEAAIPYELA